MIHPLTTANTSSQYRSDVLQKETGSKPHVLLPKRKEINTKPEKQLSTDAEDGLN